MKPQLAETKASPAAASTAVGSGEADECLFEYLHAEMVNYALSSASRQDKKKEEQQQQQQPDEEDLSKLEWMGFSVGYKVIERLTREWSRFKDELDTIKFICTDFWASLFQKQIDNLKTNHHGVYVLQDCSFRLLSRLGVEKSQQYIRETPRLLAFTCGLLRGSLANLGVVSEVTTEIVSLPGCKFHVKVHRV